MENEAISRSEDLDNVFRKSYTIWRKPEIQKPDYTLKLMKDQIAMAKVYAFIARSKEETELYNFLMKHIKESRCIVREAHSDAELRFATLTSPLFFEKLILAFIG